jgi:hypothetical protein
MTEAANFQDSECDSVGPACLQNRERFEPCLNSHDRGPGQARHTVFGGRRGHSVYSAAPTSRFHCGHTNHLANDRVQRPERMD